MAFELSFSPEFFWGEEGFYEEKTAYPTSVMQALFSMDEEAWAEMAREVFGCEPEFVDLDVALSKISETNTCTDLRPPVEVWIDDEGYYTVEVYDAPCPRIASEDAIRLGQSVRDVHGQLHHPCGCVVGKDLNGDLPHGECPEHG
jgi:hypothetical protein